MSTYAQITLSCSSASDNIRLSAILPNYNHGSMIGTAIKALLEQVPPPDEILVVDDASTDNSLALLREMALAIPTLRVLALDNNRGTIGALNLGLSEARGEYVYFGAADDLTLQGLFAQLLPLLEQNPTIAFASAEAIVVDVETGFTGLRPPIRPSDTPAVFLPAGVRDLFWNMDNWILTGAALIRRAMLNQLGGFDSRLGAQADGQLLRHLAFRYGAAFAPHLGLVWQISSTGFSRSQALNSEKSLNVLDLALQQLRDDEAVPGWYPLLFERRWRFGIGRLAIMAEPINREVLSRVAARDLLGGVVLGIAAAMGGKFGRFLALGWLVLRERPMNLWLLAMTAIKRPKIRLDDFLNI